ncbi:hypothetical protein N9924_00105 [bacterium]|nr:hypothetical protein [bacterium]
MDIKEAIGVLINAALQGRFNDLERSAINQAVKLCSQIEAKPAEPEKTTEPDVK